MRELNEARLTPMQAKFTGTCTKCGAPIVPGMPIAWGPRVTGSKGRSVTIHESCWAFAPQVSGRAVAPSKSWQELTPEERWKKDHS